MVAPDVQAAIDAARQLTGGLSSEEESSVEEEEVEERYPCRTRQPLNRYSNEETGASASAASVEPSPSVMVRDLPPLPKTVAEARKCEDWQLWEAALNEERHSMIDQKVWRKQKAPEGMPQLKTKIIFEYKANQPGEQVRAKCRLEGQGSWQKPGRDYRESWAEMPAAATTCCLLATAAARERHVLHVDIRAVYLYAPMDMKVYITITEGFDDAGEDAVLVHAMYGTKPAGCLWGNHLSGSLAEEGVAGSPAERFLFVYKTGDDVFYVVAHVDGLIIAGAGLDAVQEVKKGIERRYEVRDL